MKKDVVIIHYNTPELTEAAIKSLNKTTDGCHVIVFDNSDKKPFVNTFDNVEVIDNTKGQVIDFAAWLDTFKDKEPSPGNDYGSAKHCYSVQWIIDHRKNSFVLMDGDVLLKKDITDFWNPEMAFVGHIGCNTKRFGYTINRVEPWLCYINVKMIRRLGFSYYNPAKMWNLTTKVPDDHYDTGAWYLEEIQRLQLPYKEVDTKEFGIHYRHGSWKKKQDEKWLSENKKLYE